MYMYILLFSITDSVVSKPANKVTFVNSTSYLEIILFQLPSEVILMCKMCTQCVNVAFHVAGLCVCVCVCVCVCMCVCVCVCVYVCVHVWV